jgi:hypothetical protein
MQDRGYQGLAAAVDLPARDGKHCRRGIFFGIFDGGGVRRGTSMAWMAWQEYTAGCRAYPLSARVVREAYINPLITPSAVFFAVQLCSQQQAENFLNTFNHFHALKMATFALTSYTFAPPSYTYVPTAPRSKSTAARGKPASSIPDKLHRSKLSDAALNGPRLPATAAANNDGGYRSGIQGMF